MITTYAYDPLSRLTEVTAVQAATADTIASFVYTLAPAGNRIRIDELGGVSQAYGYDDLYRLDAETVEDPAGAVYAKSFGYDPVGNRLFQNHTVGGSTAATSYGYDERDRMLEAAGAAFTWDTNGNLTGTGDGAGYGWDPEGRLVSATLADGTVVSHGYDALGARVWTETAAPDGSTRVTEYLVDTQGALSHVVAETDGDGELLAHYVRGTDLLAAVRPLQTRYVHADVLGSVMGALTDETSAVTHRYGFTAFGELATHDGEDPNVYLFAGEARDPASGFYHLRARWMDPGLGRFVSVDPFEGFATDPVTLHPYLYAGNDPANKIDPSGRFLTAAACRRRCSAARPTCRPGTAAGRGKAPPAPPTLRRQPASGPSFDPQHHGGLDGGRPAGGQQTGGERGNDQHQRHPEQGQRVGRPDLEQEIGDRVAQGEGNREPQEEADQHQLQTWCNTIIRTSQRSAPRARRIPNSWVR